jgi:hypothetical protein
MRPVRDRNSRSEERHGQCLRGAAS